MNEVSRAFSISDIQRSLASMIGRVYASCVRSSLIYGSEVRPIIIIIIFIRINNYTYRVHIKHKLHQNI